MVKAQDEEGPKKPKRQRKTKSKPKLVMFTAGATTVTAPEGTKFAAVQAAARDVDMVLRGVNALGKWSVSYDRVRVPPDQRGRG